jgi:site-specific DNA recombinase
MEYPEVFGISTCNQVQKSADINPSDLTETNERSLSPNRAIEISLDGVGRPGSNLRGTDSNRGRLEPLNELAINRDRPQSSPNGKLATTRVGVIYTRYSSDMQRPESCADQERKVRGALTRMGFSHAEAIVLRDEAISGTRADRPEYARLLKMIESRRVSILAVDDQSRFSRGDNAFSTIQDLVYSGGRFISTGEGIDTEKTGWELQVKVMELHHSTSNRERSRQVSRGKEGRFLDGGSAGDFGFGYRSEFLDPNWVNYNGRGPRPKKKIVVYDPEAAIVRHIFVWFAEDRMSINGIARRLNEQKVDKGHRSTRPGWRAEQVRRILASTKYIGEWFYGCRKTLQNSVGKRRAVPVPEENVIRRTRPELRIVSDELWKKANVRLSELRKIYGQKPEHRPRGARAHPRAAYPAGLLNGLMYCARCNSRLAVAMGGKHKAFGCPLHPRGQCDSAVRVPYAKAEAAVVELVASILWGHSDVRKSALEAAIKSIEEASRGVPAELAILRRQRTEMTAQTDRIVEAIADGLDGSPAITQKLRRLEAATEELDQRITEYESLSNSPVILPNGEWIEQQLVDFLNLIRENRQGAALLLRELLGPVTAHHIVLPGKIRGYAQLRFTVRITAELKLALGGTLPARVLGMIDVANGSDTDAQEFCLDLGVPSRIDRAGPIVVDLRGKGMSWSQISKAVNLSESNAMNAQKRYLARQSVENTPK